MMQKKILIRQKQLKILKDEMQYNQIIYIGTQIGWGKTTLILQYLSENHYRYKYIKADERNFYEELYNAANTQTLHIVIDNVQYLKDNPEKLTSFIAQCKYTTKFYIIGRATLPIYLKTFQIEGKLCVYDNKLLQVKPKEIQELSRLLDVEISSKTADEIYRFTSGWMLGIIFILRNILNDTYDDNVKQSSVFDMYRYFDENLFPAFSEEIRTFLMNVAHLEEFTIELASRLHSCENICQVIDDILQVGSFLSFVPPDRYIIQRFFHKYLDLKQKNMLENELLKNKYEITASYYLSSQNIPKALKYYHLAENEEEMRHILIKHSEKHVGAGCYRDIGVYYTSLPEEIISKYPELMKALSMIYSIECNVEESEKYFNMLAEFERGLPKTDKRKKFALECLAYLSIGLPHRGIKDLVNYFKRFSVLAAAKKLDLQAMSITGNMPSLMNGGKDFCSWSKNDRLLYKTMAKPVGMVLGRHSDGLPEIGLGESLFEKNFNGVYTEELTLLNTGYYKSIVNKNIQLQFASTAVIARIYLSQGNLSRALTIVEKLKNNIDNVENIHENINAFLIYLHMLRGDMEYAEKWFVSEAPDEYDRFYTTERYRYITKIKIYIVKKMYTEALSLIAITENYFCAYGRVYYYMEIQILKAIILFRIKDDSWRTVFNNVLKKCEEYQFIRIVSKYGIAIWDMLNEADLCVSGDYKEKITRNTKEQAILYTSYLKAEKADDYNLTKTEKSVLKLVSDGMTNLQIAKLMEVTERTVKFHLSNIYAKLGVKSRVAAVNIFMREKLY